MPNTTQTQAGNADPVRQPTARRWQELRMDGGETSAGADAGTVRGDSGRTEGRDAGKFVAFTCPGAGLCNGCKGVK